MKLEQFFHESGAKWIQSRANAKVVGYAKLADKKHRDTARLFLAEGVKLAEEAVRHGQQDGLTLLVAESAILRDNDRVLALCAMARERSVPVTVFADQAFEKISTESAPQGVIAVVPYLQDLHQTDNLAAWQAGRRLLMLEEVRDPGNLGTILRSAEALGITGVILDRCADLYSPKVVRAAMGTLFRMPIYRTNDGLPCIRILQEQGRRVLAAGLGVHTLTLGAYETQSTDCPIIGNEGHGIADDMIAACDACLRIPMAGETESLNASAAAACILWEYFRGIAE